MHSTALETASGHSLSSSQTLHRTVIDPSPFTMLSRLAFAEAALCTAFLLLIIQLSSASTIPRVSPRGDSTFSNGKPRRNGLEVNPTGSLYCSGPYGIDTKAGIPFSRANRGRLLFYGKGEGNTPDGVTDQWVYASSSSLRKPLR